MHCSPPRETYLPFTTSVPKYLHMSLFFPTNTQRLHIFLLIDRYRREQYKENNYIEKGALEDV